MEDTTNRQTDRGGKDQRGTKSMEDTTRKRLIDNVRRDEEDGDTDRRQ